MIIYFLLELLDSKNLTIKVKIKIKHENIKISFKRANIKAISNTNIVYEFKVIPPLSRRYYFNYAKSDNTLVSPLKHVR